MSQNQLDTQQQTIQFQTPQRRSFISPMKPSTSMREGGVGMDRTASFDSRNDGNRSKGTFNSSRIQFNNHYDGRDDNNGEGSSNLLSSRGERASSSQPMGFTSARNLDRDEFG